MSKKNTITVEWVTTVTERHAAEVDAGNWQHALNNGRVWDLLADTEDQDTTLQSIAVEDRDASVDGVQVQS